MKFRYGFVSNSSSSSFVIRVNEEFNTVRNIARYIINTMMARGVHYEYSAELENLEKMEDSDMPVNFNTGGDQTFIRKVEDKFIILTTQNVEFPALFKYSLKKKEISAKFYRLFDFVNDDGEKIRPRSPEDFYGYHEKFNDFLILRQNFRGITCWIDNCPHCHAGIARGWKLSNGQKYCECQERYLLNLLSRKDKLIQINKNGSTIQ